jgi:hypothetical protein
MLKTLASLSVLVFAPFAHAHALGVEARLRGGKIEVEAYYSDDTPAGDATVMVHDHAGRFVATGRTDERGKWQFPKPSPGPYTIVVDAGAGHRKSTTIVVPAVLPPGPTGPISSGPSRAEFTRFPWERLAIGLAIIAGLGVVAWVALRRFGRTSSTPPPAHD